jgi:hypothetical protein
MPTVLADIKIDRALGPVRTERLWLRLRLELRLRLQLRLRLRL